MDVAARLTSKGQVTLPKSVRDALGLHEGDRVVFRVEGSYAILARTADLLEMAGAVPVPPIQQGTDWSEIREQTRQARAISRQHR
jgi:antitoxin PrlF